MRPRRKILLYSENSHAGSNLAFVLNTHHRFVVLQANSKIQFRAAINKEWHAVVILAFGDAEDVADAFRRASKLQVPVLVVAHSNAVNADALPCFVLPFGVSNEEIIDRLMLISGKKRGPKKSRLDVSMSSQAAEVA